MENWLNLGLGIGLLLLATEFLVRQAIKMAAFFKISPLVIGITVVALGTSLPELVVSTVAVLRGDVGLALGNIVGSNIVNIFLVLPMGILVGKLRIGTKKSQRNAWLVLLVSVMFVGLTLANSALAGMLLLSGAVLVTIMEYRWAILGRNHEDRMWLKNGHKVKEFGIYSWLLLVLALLAVMAGGIRAVIAIESISIISGISTMILGLTLSAVVTSLPELLTTILAEEEHQEKVTLGNITGSNIYNLLLIGGVVAMGSRSLILPWKNAGWLIGATLVFVAIIHFFSGKVVPKKVGLGLLVLLGVYLLAF